MHEQESVITALSIIHVTHTTQIQCSSMADSQCAFPSPVLSAVSHFHTPVFQCYLMSVVEIFVSLRKTQGAKCINHAYT